MKAPLLAVALFIAASEPACAAAGPEGRWITASGNLEVAIAPCGPALCGAVTRVLANRSMEALAKSPAPPARIGLRIITRLKPGGDGAWTGAIFDRENGKTYDCVVTPHGRTLTVRPYIWLPLFGKTQTWTRAAN